VILAAVDEAQKAGARLAAVCQVIGISARTIQRWTRYPDRDDRRCGPRHRPGNALRVGEEAKLLAVMTSAADGHLSPKQLVPQLADEGQYLASGRRFGLWMSTGFTLDVKAFKARYAKPRPTATSSP
jgi:hypothetical protein